MYYTVNVKFETIDDRTGRAKIMKEQYLVQALDISEAEKKIKDRFKDSISDFSVSSVQESKVMEVIN
jgi:hypothetical protein